MDPEKSIKEKENLRFTRKNSLQKNCLQIIFYPVIHSLMNKVFRQSLV